MTWRSRPCEGNKEEQSQREKTQPLALKLEEEASSKERKQLLEAGKGKETDCPLEPQEGALLC